MELVKVDMNPERKLITNMIVSDSFLREIMPILRIDLLKTGYAREVAGWISEYWERFKAAPKKDIEDIFLHKKQSLSEDLAENISDFLTSISREWEQQEVNNVQFAVSQAITYLKSRSLEVLREQLENITTPLQGEQIVANYKRVSPLTGEGVNVLHDSTAVVSAFMQEDETLFRFSKALGEVAGNFHRGDFVAFVAPMKRGKTWYLWHTAETAVFHGYKVLFITLEMTQNQMIRRAWQSLVGAPITNEEILYPRFRKKGDKYVIEHERQMRKGININKIESLQKILRRQARTGDVRIVSFPAATSVDDIDAVVDTFSYYENFVPDVVIIDYADLLTPGRAFRGDYRHGIDHIWKRLRRMAQERNLLMVTVSQSDRSSFNTDITESSIAEDIRKLAHVTCMLGLNQTPEEAKNGIMRVKQIAIREGRKMFESAVVLYCFSIGRAVLDSRLESEVIFELDDLEEDEEEDTKRRRRR